MPHATLLVLLSYLKDFIEALVIQILNLDKKRKKKKHSKISPSIPVVPITCALIQPNVAHIPCNIVNSKVA